jgi:hypothetical protein
LSFPILLRERGCTRQNNADLSVLSGLAIDLYRPRMLFDNDVMTDGQAEPSPFTSGLCRKERAEKLLLDLRCDTGAVVAYPDLHPVTKTSSRSRQLRLEVIVFRLSLASSRRVKSVGDQVEQNSRDLLWKAVSFASSGVQRSF